MKTKYTRAAAWLALTSVTALLLVACAVGVEQEVEPLPAAEEAEAPPEEVEAPAEEAAPTDEETELEEGRSLEPIEGEAGALRMGTLPILDVLPFYIAQEEGYFERAGITVELVAASSALERDQLMQAGEIDGMLNDLVSTGIFNQSEASIQIVSLGRVAYPDFPQFRILAAPGSGIETPADLAGVPIGISENSVIEYTTDRMLEAEGLSPDDIVTESVPSIPTRFQLLMEGQLQAANLPDPLAQGAVEAGATLVVDDTTHPEFGVSVLSFSTGAIEEKPQAIRRFLAVWNLAARDLNSDPEAYRALLLENIRVPESIQETYVIPAFPVNQVPSEAQWRDVVDWLMDKDLVDGPLAYGDSVTDGFLFERE
jgi:NitT/TauT family transport system substrate-binding protein